MNKDAKFRGCLCEAKHPCQRLEELTDTWFAHVHKGVQLDCLLPPGPRPVSLVPTPRQVVCFALGKLTDMHVLRVEAMALVEAARWPVVRGVWGS